jgi:hypothetical protein
MKDNPPLPASAAALAAGRVRRAKVDAALPLSCLLIAIAVLLGAAFLDPLFQRFQRFEDLPALLAGLILVVLGSAIGFPLPSTVRVMAGANLRREIPWMWGINGAASVFGSVLAMEVAFGNGYSAVLILGASAYLGAAMFGWSVAHGLPQHGTEQKNWRPAMISSRQFGTTCYLGRKSAPR